MTDLSKLAATGTALDLALAEVRGEVKVTKLPTKRAPRTGSGARNRRAVGGSVEVAGVAVGKGRMGNLQPVGGIGREKPLHTERAVARAERVYAEDRKDFIRERAAEREANALAELDTLLDDIRG